MTGEPNLLDDEPEIALDEPAAVEVKSPEPAVQSLAPLVEILPADFPLPALLRFVPDVRLKQAADQAMRYALSVEVSGPEGLRRADVALTALRTSLAAITESFEEPASLANDVHKRITGKRAEWLVEGTAAVRTVGKRIADEQLRLERIAAEERRKRQEEEDRKAREEARRRAAEAEKQQAPAPVVQEMRRQAERATAPPVAAASPPKLTGSSVVKTWKARVVGTPADADPNPSVAEMTPAQLAEVMVLLQNIVAGKAAITSIELNWQVLNARAKSEKGAMQIAGIEAFEDVGTRAKGSRAK